MPSHQPNHGKSEGHHANASEESGSSKGHAVPNIHVEPLRTRRWHAHAPKHGHMKAGAGRFGFWGRWGAGAGGSFPSGGTPAPDVSSQTMTPSMIRHAYGFDQLNLTGAGQTIAIVDAYDDPNIASDLAVFNKKYNLPQADFSKVVPSSGTPSSDPNWNYEISLDVEWAHAIAPGAKIILVEAATADYDSLLSAVDTAVGLGANVVSMSWGGGETPTDVANNAHFNHPGVTFVASAGDSGAGMLGPASSPYVVSVGGTVLSTDSHGNRLSENGWSGSGGGASAYQLRPNYQNGFNPTFDRSSPDVSYNASPTTAFAVYNSTGTYPWAGVGGTSAGAPQWAALFALVNQGRAQAGKAAIGNGLQYGANNALYALAGGSQYTNPNGDFYDVSIGSNGYAATAGYDAVTGLGSPVANKLIPDLINS